MENFTKKLIIFFILPLFLLFLAFGIAFFQSRQDFKLHVSFYDNFTFIKTFQNHKVIIDGGPNDQILTTLGSKLAFYDHDIDLLVLTKVDTKHVSGLVDVLKRYNVKAVLIPESSANLAAFWQFLDLVDKKHVKKMFMKDGERLWLDQSNVFDIYKSDPFFAQLSFGQTKIVIPDVQNHGEAVSDGANLVRN